MIVSKRRQLAPSIGPGDKADELYETFVPVLQRIKQRGIDPASGRFNIAFEQGPFGPQLLVEFRPNPEVPNVRVN